MFSGASGKMVGAEHAMSVQVDCVLLELVERHDFQRGLVGRVQRHFRRLAGKVGLKPACRAQAPALSGQKAGKAVFRARRRQVVADSFGIGEKFFSQHDTDGVAAKIIFGRIAATVPEKARDRLVATGHQRPAKHVELTTAAGNITGFHV